MAVLYKIDILLSTYNGKAYLRSLLDSLITQDFTDWRLVVRDDGSKDETCDILNEYVQKYPERISLLADSVNVGPSASFGRLMEFSTAPFVMFCDQDDVWLKDKVTLSFNKIIELERQFGSDVPLLVYTDSKLTDENLNIISNSAQDFLGSDQRWSLRFRNLILRNVIIGHTAIVNKRLIGLACPLPADIIMHDWWSGIITAAFGHIGYIPQPTVLYRQHAQNVFGLKKQGLIGFCCNFQKEYRKYIWHQGEIYKQIRSFYGRFHVALSKGDLNASKDVALASRFGNLEELNYLERTGFLISFYKDCPYRLKALFDLIWYYKIF